IFLAGLVISGCSQPEDLSTAELQRYYAKKGEEMTPTISRVEQSNPRGGTTPHISTKTPPVRE
ncbi:MAG: hypothetical protein WBL39_21155, partial [Terrimicrobiaceae bacterium]